MQGQFYEFRRLIEMLWTDSYETDSGGGGDVSVTFDFVSGPDRDIRIQEVLTEYLPLRNRARCRNRDRFRNFTGLPALSGCFRCRITSS